jgi:uncharacterized repeat protein (TIGR03847 family)
VSSYIELDPVARITAAAIGEPGQRAFYLQARKDDMIVSVLMEKQQVALLAMHIKELLERVGGPSSDEAPDLDVDALDLEEPINAEFRVGQIGLGYDETRDLVLVQCDEFVPEPDEGAEEPRDEDPGRLRLWATREQMHALALRSEQEVAAGRPICPMCGEAMDPDGHFCIRSNGHREVNGLT